MWVERLTEIYRGYFPFRPLDLRSKPINKTDKLPKVKKAKAQKAASGETNVLGPYALSKMDFTKNGNQKPDPFAGYDVK